MARIEMFEDLEVWKLVRLIGHYIETRFQRTNLGKNYSLRDQMERSSGSIMDKLAEGFGRYGNREFHYFLSYSKGSCAELKSQVYRASVKNLISTEQANNLFKLIDKTTNKLGAFMFHIRKSDYKVQKFKSPKN